MVSIVEFSDDFVMVEIFYQEFISFCGLIYNEYYVYVYDYQFCYSEQIFR